jgi:hypothetical protein
METCGQGSVRGRAPKRIRGERPAHNTDGCCYESFASRDACATNNREDAPTERRGYKAEAAGISNFLAVWRNSV